MDDADLGTLEQHGDDVVVTFTRRLPHPIAKVWRAVTEPEHLAAWFPGTIAVDEWRPGAPLRFTVPTGDTFDGEVLAVEPPTLLELRWGTDRLRIALAGDGDGTVLTLADTFAELGKAARDAAGWHECLDRLIADLDGAPPPEPGASWRAVHPLYVERFGPDASTMGPPEGVDG
jgi:uncharacterized protein YndB with AHSA1/START domain